MVDAEESRSESCSSSCSSCATSCSSLSTVVDEQSEGLHGGINDTLRNTDMYTSFNLIFSEKFVLSDFWQKHETSDSFPIKFKAQDAQNEKEHLPIANTSPSPDFTLDTCFDVSSLLNIPDDRSYLCIHSKLTRVSELHPLLNHSINDAKIRRCLFSNDGAIDIETLKSASWNGMPAIYRPIGWKYLLGYLPPSSNKGRHGRFLERKRSEYFTLASSLGIYPNKTPGFDLNLYHQIEIDIPRTTPDLQLFKLKPIQEMMERVLYCWSIRHPASGYVQGLNDILTPFVFTFLVEYIYLKASNERLAPANMDDDLLKLLRDNMTYEARDTDAHLRFGEHYYFFLKDLPSLEADAFWCFSKLLDNLQDFYTVGQPGIIRQMSRLTDLMNRLDKRLMAHLKLHDIEFFHFIFRWMNCLLVREMPLEYLIRLWDTCLAEGEKGFSEFYLYVMAALLSSFSSRLQALDFQGIILFLQNVHRMEWNKDQLVVLTAEAYMLKELFSNSKAHLNTPPAYKEKT